MTDHLQDCCANDGSMFCICDALRACEQRVEREWIEHCNRVEARTLQAARDAVVERSMTCLGPAMPGTEWVHTPSVLAAIDALKGEQA